MRQSRLIAIVIKRNDLLFEQLVQRFRIRIVVVVNLEILGRIADRPSVVAVISFVPPSITLTLSTPFMAAFRPLVPHASSGGRGLFSQMSTPWVKKCAACIS